MIQFKGKLEGGALMRGIAALGLALLAAGSMPAATVAVGQLQLIDNNGYQALTFYNKTGAGNGGCDGVEYQVCNGVTIQSWTLTITYTNTGNSTPRIAPPPSPATFTSTAADTIPPYNGSGPGYTGSPTTGTWEIPLTGIGGTEPACPPCDYQIAKIEFSGTFNSANIPFTIGSPGNQSEFGANPSFDTVWTAPASLYGNSLNSQFFGAQFDVMATDRQSAPLIVITKTHSGNFTQGQAGAIYSVTVLNQANAAATSGTVTVTEAAPSGLTLVSMAGSGWACPSGGSSCTRGDALAGGASYPPITVTVNVASNAASPQVNSVTASGGGSASATDTDSTTVNTPIAPLGTLAAGAALAAPGSASTIAASVCSYATQCFLVMPGVFSLPVSLSLNSGISVNSLTFGIQIAPNGGAPGLTGALGFTPAGSITDTPLVSAGSTSNSISVLWSSLSKPLSGVATVGTVTGTLPASAATGQSYMVTVTGVSGAIGSVAVPLTAGASAAINVSPTYLVGDVGPHSSDAAPNFGDGVMNIVDLIQELFAVNNVPGFQASYCSDRLDAMDLYPADTAATRGGDGFLDIRDLILELFRVNNLDTSRPLRSSRGGVCASGSSGNSISPAEVSRSTARQQRPQAAVQGALMLGRPERTGDAEERIPVYLEARQNLVRVAVTLGLGDQKSQLRFVATPDTPPSLAQDSELGIVAAAWLNGLSVPAGQRLLLGYVEGPAGALANLKMYGVSASGLDDNREVLLDAPAAAGQER
jgi:uncharacterized repeat protein (TIGR01451 family)